MNVRPIQPNDYPEVAAMCDAFGDYIVGIDDMHRQIRRDGHGPIYLRQTLEEVKSKDGFFLVAEKNGHVVGFIAGTATNETSSEIVDIVPTKAGRVTELFVADGYRGKGIGTTLMQAAEEIFRGKGCNVVRVEVFEPNHAAHQFYRGLGYRDRNIDLIKLL